MMSALFVGVHLIPNTIKGRGQRSIRGSPLSLLDLLPIFSSRFAWGVCARFRARVPSFGELADCPHGVSRFSGIGGWSDGRIIDEFASYTKCI